MKLLAQALQGSDYQGGFGIKLPSQINTIANLFNGFTFGKPLITLVIDLMLFGVMLLTLFYIIFAGFNWMISQGDKKAVEQARTGLTYAILGFAIAMVSFLIVNVIGAFFGVPLLGGS